MCGNSPWFPLQCRPRKCLLCLTVTPGLPQSGLLSLTLSHPLLFRLKTHWKSLTGLFPYGGTSFTSCLCGVSTRRFFWEIEAPGKWREFPAEHSCQRRGNVKEKGKLSRWNWDMAESKRDKVLGKKETQDIEAVWSIIQCGGRVRLLTAASLRNRAEHQTQQKAE